jgi:integrase/recombinase XerD
LNNIIETFTTALQAEGQSANTIKNYLVAVRQLLRAHKNNPSKITQESLDLYFSGFNARNGTQNYKKNAINKFMAFLYARKRIKTPFKASIKTITMAEPEYLSKAEQDRFFAVLQSEPGRLRDFTLFAVMLFTGLRVSEAVNIRVKDIQADKLSIVDSKTGPGKVYIRKSLVEILEKYLAAQAPRLKPGDYIFQSGRKHRLTERWVQLLIKKYLLLAGITKDITPHSLRHTFAARLRQSGSDIEIIQQTLRHKYIQSTTRYSHIKNEELKNAVERSVKIPSFPKKVKSPKTSN